MPILFIFPILSVILIIANAKNIDTTQLEEKSKSNINEEDIQDLTFFDMINKK